MIAEEKIKGKKSNVVIVDEEILDGPQERKDTRYSEFHIKKLIMEKGQWNLHLEIKKEFEKVYLDYVVEMVVDLEQIDWRIEQKKKAKLNYETQNQMEAFDDLKKFELDAYENRINELKIEREERIALCPKISFAATVRSFDDKSSPTKIVFLIPDTIIELLNTQKNLLECYKIELIKDLNND